MISETQFLAGQCAQGLVGLRHQAFRQRVGLVLRYALELVEERQLLQFLVRMHLQLAALAVGERPGSRVVASPSRSSHR